MVAPFAHWQCTTPEQPFHVRKAAVPVSGSLLSLDGSTRQNWEGVGGAFSELGWLALQKLAREDRERALDSLFAPSSGCAFNYCRIPIGASDFAERWYSANEVDGDFDMQHFSIERDRQCLIPFIRAAQVRNPAMRFFASPWSPPTWMKAPPVYNHGTLRWEERNLCAYAKYLRCFVQAYASEGISIGALHVQNEPHSDQKFPSCVWTGEELRVFIRDYLGPEFERQHVGTEIWLGTLERDDFDGMTQTVLLDDAARRYVSGVGYQWAGRYCLQRTRDAWPELRLLGTESECGDGANTWTFASYVFRLIREHVRNGCVGYIYWNMVLPTDGKSTWGWRQNSLLSVDVGSGAVRENPEFSIMRHVWAFVKPGARVLGLKGPLSAHALCFENPDQALVLCVQNPLTRPFPFTFAARGQILGAELPSGSANTFVISR
jgi:glucosylceramidase